MTFVEDVGKRSQNAKHFYDATTNKWKAEFTIAHRHYKDDSDVWQDLDENFEDGGIYTKKCDKTRHAIHIGNGGARRWYPRRNVTTEYVDILSIEYHDGSRWRNLNLPTPVWTNNKTEWDMTNLYASITNTWKRIKTDFTLKNSNAFTRLRFEVSFTGLTYNATTGELTSTTDGLVWGYISKPVAQDANEVDVPVTQTYDGTYIEWSVDTTGATFPIDIDPTFTDGYGGDVSTYKDTYTASAAATTNYGTNIYISPRGTVRYGLIQFDLSSIDASASCTSANLYTYASYDTTDATVTYYELLVANSGWTEAGATWNHAVEDAVEWAGGNNGGGVSGTDHAAGSIGSHSTFDVDAFGTEYTCALTTSDVEDWFGAGNANYGMVSKSSNLNITNAICSSDHATTGYRPKLVVEYTGGGGEALNVNICPENNSIPGVRIYTP